MKALRLLVLLPALFGACGVTFRPDPPFDPSRLTVWADTPVQVIDRTGMPEYASSVDQAVRDLSDRVGCPIAVMGPRGQIEVTVDSLSGAAADIDGETVISGAHATIKLYGPGDVVGAYLATLHQLGHVFGLAHDLRGHSVMQPDVTGDATGLDPLGAPIWDWHLPRVSDVQSAALHDLYCRKGG